jgi:hypothetical protein
LLERSDASRERLAFPRLVVQITLGEADYYVLANHEAASKFVVQRRFAAKYSADG